MTFARKVVRENTLGRVGSTANGSFLAFLNSRVHGSFPASLVLCSGRSTVTSYLVVVGVGTGGGGNNRNNRSSGRSSSGSSGRGKFRNNNVLT